MYDTRVKNMKEISFCTQLFYFVNKEIHSGKIKKIFMYNF